MRRIARTELRVREAARLGFRRVLVPEGTQARALAGVELIEVGEVADAVAWLCASARVHPPVNSR